LCFNGTRIDQKKASSGVPLLEYISRWIVGFSYYHLLYDDFELSLVKSAKKLVMMKRTDSKFDLFLVKTILGDRYGLSYFVRIDSFAIAGVVDWLFLEGIRLSSASWA